MHSSLYFVIKGLNKGRAHWRNWNEQTNQSADIWLGIMKCTGNKGDNSTGITVHRTCTRQVCAPWDLRSGAHYQVMHHVTQGQCLIIGLAQVTEHLPDMDLGTVIKLSLYPATWCRWNADSLNRSCGFCCLISRNQEDEDRRDRLPRLQPMGKLTPPPQKKKHEGGHRFFWNWKWHN